MTMTRALRIPLLAGGLAILLAACSGGAATPTSPANTPAATTSDGGAAATNPVASAPTAGAGAPGDDADSPACKLVTKDQVATAAGYSIATALGAGGTCIYQNTDPSKVFAVQLFDSRDAMALYLNVEPNAAHIDGLGDDAFYQSVAGFLFVRKGDRAFLLLNQGWVMTDPSDTVHRDAFVTLARAALPNL